MWVRCFQWRSIQTHHFLLFCGGQEGKIAIWETDENAGVENVRGRTSLDGRWHHYHDYYYYSMTTTLPESTKKGKQEEEEREEETK